MAKSISEQIEKIKNSIISGTTSMMTDLGTKAMNDLSDAHKDIIEQFYSGYTPRIYNRTGELKNTAMVQPVYLLKGNGSIKAKTGLIASSYGMNESYGISSSRLNPKKRLSAKNVFDLMWNVGVRGLPNKGTTPLSHSYTWYGHSYKKGEIWVNPYYRMFTVALKDYGTDRSNPHIVMRQAVKYWGDKKGKEWLNANAKSYFRKG